MKQVFTLLVLLSLCAPGFAVAVPSGAAGSFASRQGQRVSGVVQDEDGNPILGATVTAVSATTGQIITGTYTDASGRFSLTIPSGSNVEIRVSFVNYKTSSFAPGENLTVVLEEDPLSVSETVVTGLGQVKSRDQIAYGSSTVGGQELVQSGETSVLTGMSGKAAGVNITRSSGDPGAGSYILLRGQKTVGGSTQPLIILDGVPMDNSTIGSGVAGVTQQSRLNDINPNDIESIEIIKGGAGAALWGSRAQSGVIVITTKKGNRSQGRVDVNFTTTLSIDEANQQAELQDRFGGGYFGTYYFNPPGGLSWGDPIFLRDGSPDVLSGNPAYVQFPDGSIRQEIATGGNNNPTVYDNVDDIFQTGYFWDNQLSVSTANERSEIFFSLGYLDQEGVIRLNSDYDRYNLGLRAGHRITDNFKLSMSANYVYSDSRRVQQGSNLSGLLLGLYRTPADYENAQYYGTYVDGSGVAFPNRQVSYRNPLGSSTNSIYDNPNYTLNRNFDRARVNRLFGNLQADWNVLPWLTITERLGVDFYTDERRIFYDKQSNESGDVGAYEEFTITNTQINNDVFASAAHKFSDLFRVAGTVGLNLNHERYQFVDGFVQNFVLPNAPPNLSNGLPENITAANELEFIRRSAGYATLDLFFLDDMFQLTATGRLENSSAFGPDADPTFFYPAVTLGWEFSKLGLFEGSEIVSFGKLRLAVSRIGAAPGGPYAFQTSYFGSGVSDGGWGGAIDGGQYGVGGYQRSGTAANTSLRPEQIEEFEAGLDMRFFNDRLSLSMNYYTNETIDGIISAGVAPSSGYTESLLNIARLMNVGFEAEIQYNWFRKGDWSITTSGYFTHNRNRVLSLSGGASVLGLAGFTEPASSLVAGQPFGVIYGLDWARNADGSIVLDPFGFPDGALATEKPIGDPNPDFRASIGNEITWKNLTLYFLFDMAEGFDMWNGTKGALTYFGRSGATDFWNTYSLAEYGGSGTTPVFDYFGYDLEGLVADGVAIDNGDGTVSLRGYITDFGAGPVIVNEFYYWSGPGSGFTGPSSQFIEDGTNIRLRELTLRYRYTSEWLTNVTKLKSVEIGFTGRNLVLWTDYTGIDPESNLTGASAGRGLDYFNHPNTRSYVFSLSLTY